MSHTEHSFYHAVYRLVSRIPRGQVATYGQLAAILGSPRASRAVGYALFNLSHEDARAVPWQRVINAQGMISARGDVIRAEIQQHLLESEGVVFDGEGRVDLSRYRWKGPEWTSIDPES